MRVKIGNSEIEAPLAKMRMLKRTKISKTNSNPLWNVFWKVETSLTRFLINSEEFLCKWYPIDYW